jgi:hypothetical protein
MLIRAEFSTITENTNPLDVYFLSDLTRSVRRLTRGTNLLIKVNDASLAPYNEDFCIFLYIRLSWPVMFPGGDFFTIDREYSLWIYLINGTATARDDMLKVAGLSTFDRLMTELSSMFSGTGRDYWDRIAREIDIRLRLNLNLFRIYLCPAKMTLTDRANVAILHASHSISLGQVFREIKWGDWFTHIPLIDVMPRMDLFGLLIVPIDVQPWISNNVFYEDMHKTVVTIGAPNKKMLL